MQIDSKDLRGNGFLSRQLGKTADLKTRRRISLRDWLVGFFVVVGGQIVGVTHMEWMLFWVLLGALFLAVLAWMVFYPRLSDGGTLAHEALQGVAAVFLTTLLVAISGGADSPYVFFFALAICNAASFLEVALARWSVITLAVLGALSPIVYDWPVASKNDFIVTIVFAVFIWLASAFLIGTKRSSTVRAEHEARRLAYVDVLTGAGSRRALDQYAAEVAAQGEKSALVRIDAVGVDLVNRSAGHLAGDELMRRIVHAMRSVSGERDQVVRLGGIEFAVLMPGADIAAANRFLMRFHERLELANSSAGDGNRVSAIGGVAAGGDLASMIQEAERDALSLNDHRQLPVAVGSGVADRAAHLHKQVERSASVREMRKIESVKIPAPVALAVPACVGLALAIGSTGGSASPLMSFAILVVTFFAVFGSRMESTVATLLAAAAVAVAVLANLPIDEVDQMRALTVLVTMFVLADTVQVNARSLMLAERRAAELSLVDPQTGLGNRTAFERNLIAVLSGDRHDSRVERFEGVPAVIVIDFIDYPSVRMHLSAHDAELLLVEVVAALRDAIGGEGSVYRVGSDDFAITLRAHHQHHVDEMIERCALAMHELESGARYRDLGQPLEFIFGGAMWEEGMTAADLAAAAVSRQVISHGHVLTTSYAASRR
jgi:diguanylate cyclase (GGDEF)-like protein